MSAAPPDVRQRRVCVYYPWLYLTSGAERTILEFARRSRHRVTILTNEYQPDAVFPEMRQCDVRVLSRVPVKRTLGAVARAAARILTQRVDFSEFDVLLVVCEGLGDLVVLRNPRVPVYCLCLTPLRIVFDPVYRRVYLEGRGPFHRAAVRVAGAAFAVVDRMAWRRYRRVFAISSEVERRILSGRLAPGDRLQRLHPGVDLTRHTPSPAQEKTFFVPGRIMWTKNLELAIEAFRSFSQRMDDPQEWSLRIAGIVDRKSEPYLKRLQALAAGDPRIVFHIHPTDAEIDVMYRRAFATLFTAFNEDWGLVVIEAMACGKPVVAVNRGGPTEILEPGRGGLLAEPDPEAFAKAMHALATDRGLYDRLSATGPASAARFGWQGFVDVLDEALAAPATTG